MICIRCGYEYASDLAACPLCSGEWQAWELLFAPHALDDLRAQVMGWIGQLPFPSVIEWVASSNGLRVRLYLPPQVGNGVVPAWAGMTGQHSRWRELGKMKLSHSSQVLVPSSRLPSLIASTEDSDPLLAIGSRLVNSVHEGKEVHLRAWLLGNEVGITGTIEKPGDLFLWDRRWGGEQHA